MTPEFFYPYPTLISGILRKRYKRFFADIELESGEIVVAHCPNTGPMIGVCQIGNPVYLSQSNNPKRKLAYSVFGIHLGQNRDGKQGRLGILLSLTVIKSAVYLGNDSN